MKNNKFQILLIFGVLLILISCNRFLDIKPDKKLAVPSELTDFRALLNSSLVNFAPSEGEIMARDHYLSDKEFLSIKCETNRALYLFEDDSFSSSCVSSTGWARSYQNILRSNVVLLALDKNEKSNGITVESKDIRGHALYLRAINHFEVVQIWADAYNSSTVKEKLGIPLKFSDDFNEKTERSTLEKSFEQILIDLIKAEELLPIRQPNLIWPSKVTAWAYLARVYLYMGNFEKAREYASKTLTSHHKLLDFRTIPRTNPIRLPNWQENSEIINFKLLESQYESLHRDKHLVNNDLLKTYHNDDLRKNFYYSEVDQSIRFSGNLAGNIVNLFCGLTLGEMYLILSECQARMGEDEQAIKTLKTLLENRGVQDFEISNTKLLEIILLERRKELIRRGLDFYDVKRLNVLGAGISLKRVIQEKEYVLNPNDPRFTLLIPENVIRLSGIQQNTR